MATEKCNLVMCLCRSFQSRSICVNYNLTFGEKKYDMFLMYLKLTQVFTSLCVNSYSWN